MDNDTVKPADEVGSSDQVGLVERAAFEAWAMKQWGRLEGAPHNAWLGFAAGMAAERQRCAEEDIDLLRQALLALTYHRDQTRPIADSDAVIDRLRTRLWA